MPAVDFGGHAPNFDSDRHWVAPNAYVIGNVVMGMDVGVWFAATVRGDNEQITIGDMTNVQDGAVLHSDPGAPLTIGRGVTIGHCAVVHGCTIGDNTLIGMGATILNNAVIGANCIVGANALVTEGKVYPDNSLIVGSPAKAVRTLDSAEDLKRSAAHYADNMKRFRKASNAWRDRG